MLVSDDTPPRIVRTEEARRIANEMGLDLVEVSPNQSPPVCRILDYGKFRYHLAKKEKLARQNSSASNQMREIRLTPQISLNDLSSKMASASNMLRSGSKVRITVFLKGRMIMRPAIGLELLEQVKKLLAEVAKIDREPAHEKRIVSMIVSPLVGVVRKKQNNSNGRVKDSAKAQNT